MPLHALEKEFSFECPMLHQHDMEDPSSFVHAAMDFLMPDGAGLLDFAKVNRSLRADSWQGWSERFVAFASNGCGDYFAYDLSVQPYKVIYVDPLEPLTETSLVASDHSLVFSSYAAWREYMYEQFEERTGGV